MVQPLMHTALAAALLVSANVTPSPISPSASLQETVSLAKKTQTIWVVKPEDTLTTIAKSYYGDDKYWTTLWNDNPQIEDIDTLDVGEILSIRQSIPVSPEKLKDELSKKLLSSGYGLIQGVAIISAPTTPLVPFSGYTGGPLTEEQITYLGTCEAGMNPARNSGNGYYGAFQFSIGTWNSMGTGYERADLAPIEVQKDAVQRLLSRSSIFTQFPGCSRKMQANGIL